MSWPSRLIVAGSKTWSGSFSAADILLLNHIRPFKKQWTCKKNNPAPVYFLFVFEINMTAYIKTKEKNVLQVMKMTNCLVDHF